MPSQEVTVMTGTEFPRLVRGGEGADPELVRVFLLSSAPPPSP